MSAGTLDGTVTTQTNSSEPFTQGRVKSGRGAKSYV